MNPNPSILSLLYGNNRMVNKEKKQCSVNTCIGVWEEAR